MYISEKVTLFTLPMAKRIYKKSSPYWEQRKSLGLKTAIELALDNHSTKRASAPVREMPVINYEFGGEFESKAAYQDSFSPSIAQVSPYRNISAGMLPWEAGGNGYTSISTAILLCQRAYANVAIFRNAIESAVEFSNSPIHFKSDNATVVNYFNSWANKIGIYGLKDQWFRERYRSGNNYVYRFMGRMDESKYGQMKTVFGAKSPYIPIRYTILNPAQVYLTSGVVNGTNFVKALSSYEVMRLRNPKTPEDKIVFDSLPEDVQKQIMKGDARNGIFIPLDPSRLITNFYKKQDYEPMGIPMGFPLLNDLEHKLELKKMDMSLSRTIEHVLLLVTTGEKAEEWGGGGINPQNVANLQNIFRNQTLGRVLVADYTTKAEWKIPDIAAILGPEKFIQVEKDIREGLQSVFVGDDKFANASMKAKIYTERMKEGQRVFITEFLLPEVRMICEAMNFRDVPEIEFEPVDLDDTSQRERVILRLAEIGILTPDEVFTALESGILPDKNSNIKNQVEYKKSRENDLFVPLIGGAKEEKQDGGEGRPGGSGTKKTAVKPGKIGVTKAAEKIVSAKELARLSVKADRLKEKIIETFCKKHKLKEAPSSMVDIATSLAKSIMANEPDDKWDSSLTQYLKSPKEINPDAAELIDYASMEFDVDDWQAILIVKAQAKNQ